MLWRALEPVLRDIARTEAPTPRFEDSEWGVPDLQVTAMMWGGSSGMGVTVATASSPVQQIVAAADAVQEFVIEELWGSAPTNWPRCQIHPETHPLVAAVVADAAVWQCPRTGEMTAEIGSFPA